ncbi:hypothetical protein EJ02DRAFT_510407 [Clathrospora elynae]|uniref:Geranylgeranyl transferase type II subunit alpha n=1 Tax=Clathrospora elynae TaxID=706981 RepID=A0A6A5SWR5_9PLEO|nr:hypothetical protein EJ02DRAFT_510407 [Clathrospora elynae]
MASHGISRGSGPVVRSEEARQKELQQIADYKDVADLVNAKMAEKQYTIEVLGLVTKLLHENPEYYTIWNHRRRVLISLVSEEAPTQPPDDLLQGDLQLTFALLRKFPKCYWIWNHRNWLLREGETLMGADAACKLWSGELQLINKMLHADSRNFHAWGYRRFVVSQIERLTPAVSDSTMKSREKSLTESEFEYTTKMIKTNLSNFSAWHNRSQLIPQILGERNADGKARRVFLDAELSLICEAINTDPFDQSIWFYHQYLLSILSPTCPPHQLVVQDLTGSERQRYYEHEMAYIREILEDEEDCKWVYEALLGLAEYVVGERTRCAAYRWYSSCIRAILCFLNSPSNVATPIDTPTIAASATGRIRPAISLTRCVKTVSCKIGVYGGGNPAGTKVGALAPQRAKRASMGGRVNLHSASARRPNPPPPNRSTICRGAQMSRWRQKGFVQDSDEEEEESQIESQGSKHDASLSGRVERVDDGGGQEDTKDGGEEIDGSRNSAGVEEQERVITTPMKRTPPKRPTPSPFTARPTLDFRREPAESSDLLQSSPTPRQRRIKPPPSSQSLASPVPQHSPPLPVAQSNGLVAIPSQTTRSSTLPPREPIANHLEHTTHASDILGKFGIAPLSDESGDEALSDPPSDLESPPTAFITPHRRTAVHVVIPSSTALQRQLAEHRSRREFRQRKPIQVHPYALEGELYRREVQSRGLKPVRRERSRSPQRHQRQQEAESQEQEFDPDEFPMSSPPEVEIPVSTPVIQRPRKDPSKTNSVRRPTSDPTRRISSTQLHHPRAAKRRRLNFSSTQVAAATTRVPEDHTMPRNIWTIPNSPPYSSSPPLNGNDSARRLDRHRVTTPAPNLPTPSTSSVFQDDPQPLLDFDSEPVPRSASRSNGELRRLNRVVITDSSSSAAESASEPEQSDHELRQVGRKIKGVLPASWLRFDRQAQERRKAQQQDRARTNAVNSPEPTEPLRGVAQRVTKTVGRPRETSAANASSRDLVVISDDSDDELTAPVSRRAANMQNSVEDASALATIFDNRYADDDLSDMEHDRLDLPTLGGTGPKRRRQTKLADAFGKAKRLKSSGDVAKAAGSGKRSHGGQASKKKHSSSRLVRHTPLPAMSVIDVDLSPSRRRNDVPQFLRVAKRQALRRPDLARQSPRDKQLRLHNAQDTEEANLALRQWRRGTLKPKAGIAPQRQPTRRPLADKPNNQQRTQKQATGDIDSAKGLDIISEAGTEVSQPRRRRNFTPGLHIFERSSTQKTKASQLGIQTSKSSKGSRRVIPKGPLPFRTAQLEGDEQEFGRGHRKIAFEKGLLRVDQQFGLQIPEEQPFVNPQLARYLADDNIDLPPLTSANDIDERQVQGPRKQLPPPRRRLVRKSHAQRIDIDAREYRQPSEPTVQEILTITSVVQHPEVDSEKDLPVLHGLGPHGTRYPITFDVHSLASETYFHSTTFIGSDEFRRVLSAGKIDSRDLDEPAGYCTIAHDTLSARCGPWNDETSSRLHDLVKVVLAPLDNQSSDHDTSPVVQGVLVHSARFIRALTGYISNHLNFLDPIDRKDFVVKMIQVSRDLFESVSAAYGAISEQSPALGYTQSGIRAMTYVLAMNLQLHRIAQHTTVSPSHQMDVTGMIKNVSKTIVMHLVRQGVPELSNFLEQNKRHSVRENGVQESDVYVESTVICMQVLEDIDMPAWGFWDLVSQELCPKVANATHISSFETTWATLVTFLPFVEVDVSGIPARSRRETFQSDNWICIRDLLRRLFVLYPSTYSNYSTSLNDYVRANLARCHRLVIYWHWKRPDAMLNTVFDFFGKNGLKPLRGEASSGSVSFLDHLATEQSLAVEPNENSFHIALKCLALGLQGMKDVYSEKKIRSFVFRTLPNHGRAYPKDQPLDQESLSALRNHHDLLSTLYWAAPPPCRPKLDHIRDLVNHENSHREACRLSVRAWANLTTFQLSTEEPYTSARPFAKWHKDIMHQTLKQYRLARTEADDYLKSGVLDGTSDVSAVMVRQTMERNQEQVIATLRDCIAGMKKAIQHARDQSSLRTFLIDSDIMHLLELPHLEDRRLVNVIRDTLKVLQDYAILRKSLLKKEVSQQANDESQDYGDFPEIDDLNDLDEINSNTPEKPLQQSGLDFIQTPLWHLLSNAFGAENSPDDNLLMDCIDTWVRISECQVTSGERSWSYYLDSFSQVSWKQLRQTEQTRKFGPYFMAALVDCDSAVYEEHRHDFLQALLTCLAERESMLRFQHRLLKAIARTDDSHPLMQNLPFFRMQETGELDITAETVRNRRLALISSILSNMRDDVLATQQAEPTLSAEVKRGYAAMLKDFMTAMKYNYQQLRQGTTITGAYVEFVQKIVQFLKQYTSDIYPVLPFFTDSVAFPLPAADPTYVVARLCGYAPKLSDLGTVKQLSVFIQTVAQQAAADNQQAYLVNQITTALCTDEAPHADRAALRTVLLQGVFPAYLEEALSSSVAFVIARPILQSLPLILDTMIFDLRITQPDSLSSILGSIVAVSHAFIRGSEQIKDNPQLFQQPYVLSALTHMLDAMSSILPLVDYICSRTMDSTHCSKPPLVDYMDKLSVFIAEMINRNPPLYIPSYAADAHASPLGKQHIELVSFCKGGLVDSMKSNWSESSGAVWFGQGHAKREVLFDIGTVEEERERLAAGIGTFSSVLREVYEEEGRVYGGGMGGGHEGDEDVII